MLFTVQFGIPSWLLSIHHDETITSNKFGNFSLFFFKRMILKDLLYQHNHVTQNFQIKCASKPKICTNCQKSLVQLPASRSTTLSHVRGMGVSSVTVTDLSIPLLHVVSLLSVNQLELRFPLTVKFIRASMNILKSC